MKNNRQELILSIIGQEDIETQEQLIARLEEHGIRSTQATVSRDIKQMHLVKEPTGNGGYRYAVSEQRAKLDFAGRLQTILRESIVGVDYAQNLIVIRTMPGLANGAASAFDGMNLPNKLGTLAGDDTLMIVMRDEKSASELCAEIARMQSER